MQPSPVNIDFVWTGSIGIHLEMSTLEEARVMVMHQKMLNPPFQSADDVCIGR